ncbi:uncharacterized protein LOC113332505 [Papaver somniferum]|uniref:uncharacterized protein LOC113332505 n=1 Tax=Papaver somniferum TaxID=3469 RepID=UPI000E701D41|nr:uncharacterized protein LOC113332505 [Papaver somniferum]
MEFQWLMTNMIPNGANADEGMLCAFPFSLLDTTKDWLYYLPPGSITIWNGLKRLFLERYFPASKATQIRKEICGMKQSVGESLYECWERYKRLVASFPHHQFSDALIIQYFYEGLQASDRNFIDAASGGALMNKTVIQARELIESMAKNSQQFSSRGSEPPTKGVNQVDEIIELRQQMSNMMAMMQQIAAVVVKPPRPTYENVEHVNAIFSIQPYGTYSNTHEQVASTSSVYNHPSEFQQQVQQPQQAQNSELEKMVTLVETLMSMVQQNQQLSNLNQQKPDNAIKDLQTQVGSVVEEINQLHAQNGLLKIIRRWNKIEMFGMFLRRSKSIFHSLK